MGIVKAKAVSVIMIIVSFLFLLQFGLSLAVGYQRRWRSWLGIIPLVLFGSWVLYLGKREWGSTMQLLRQVEIGARNTLGVTGAFVTAFALVAYSDELKDLSRTISRNLKSAGIAFIGYGVFASSLFAYAAYFYLPVPAEMFRGFTAVLIAYFIIKALNIFDVETRKRIEQQTRHLVQAEKLASLGQLAAGIAHEINNPLTNASLGIQTLRNRLVSMGTGQEIVGKLNAVEKNIDRASSIAQELLQFSRQQESEFRPININTVITSSLMLMKHKLDNVVVDKKLSPVPDIMGDPVKLEQVIINILANSMESMNQGGRLEVSTLHRNGMIEATISDTGCGISEENISRVFEPFFTTKELGAGTGLGLSICYGIIKQHHGTINIRSAVGSGTTVTLAIPDKEHDEENTSRRR
jgi:signal transduction histidine kinase